MNKIVLYITVLGAALLISNPVLAKGKGQGKEKRQSTSQIENTNRQSLDDSYRAQERANERHDMHDQGEYGQERQRIETPVDNLIDRSFDSLKSRVLMIWFRLSSSVSANNLDLFNFPS